MQGIEIDNQVISKANKKADIKEMTKNKNNYPSIQLLTDPSKFL